MLRDLFPGYFRPNDNDYQAIWDDAFFVIDTSALLHLYRLSKASRDEYLHFLTQLMDRIWIPHQVAIELLQNRLVVISERQRAFDDFDAQLNKLADAAPLQSQDFREQLSKELEAVRALAQSARTEFVDLVGATLSTSDGLLIRIETILGQNIGIPFTNDRLDQLYEDAKTRYDQEIPPGYKDSRKDEPKRFGDFVIWSQVIDQAKLEQKPAIFVTRDAKEDWWWIHNNNHTIGPRVELVDEFLRETGQNLLIYKSDVFLQAAGEYLNESVSADVIEEVAKPEPIGVPKVVTAESLQRAANAMSLDSVSLGYATPFANEAINRIAQGVAGLQGPAISPTVEQILSALAIQDEVNKRTYSVWTDFLREQGFSPSQPSSARITPDNRPDTPKLRSEDDDK
jgi:hypothetical protein